MTVEDIEKMHLTDEQKELIIELMLIMLDNKDMETDMQIMYGMTNCPPEKAPEVVEWLHDYIGRRLNK